MDDVKRGSNREGEVHLTFAIAPHIICDTLSITFHPESDVMSHGRPMEAKAKAEESFVETNVGATRASVEMTEDFFTT